VHFDLKCDNVLTARQLGIAGGVTCKVADFGLSKQQKGTAVGVSLGGSSSLTAGNNAGGHNPGHGSRNPQGHREFTSGIASQRGTLPWTAPELFSDPQSATEKVDVYSFGVTMWELWTCDVPFKDLREQSVVWGIMTGKRPELSDTAKEPFAGYKTLMKSCWSEDVQKRPNFDDVVAQLEVATNSNEGLSKS
jgi:serine/threonine protein kinase|tara:strand:- start:2383 stop:2958 length:576 start_codon:yes stop_codon:yes gene_type:complete